METINDYRDYNIPVEDFNRIGRVISYVVIMVGAYTKDNGYIFDSYHQEKVNRYLGGSNITCEYIINLIKNNHHVVENDFNYNNIISTLILNSDLIYSDVDSWFFREEFTDEIRNNYLAKPFISRRQHVLGIHFELGNTINDIINDNDFMFYIISLIRNKKIDETLLLTERENKIKDSHIDIFNMNIGYY